MIINRIQEENRKFIQFWIVILSMSLIAFFRIVDGQYLRSILVVVVLFFSFKLNSENLILMIFTLFILNAYHRRLLSVENIYYIKNDPLILIVYLPILILIYKERIKISLNWALLLLLLSINTIIHIASNPQSVAWGFLNIIFAIMFGFVLQKHLNRRINVYIINLGILSSFYIFVQKIDLPFYDVGWCEQRRSQFYILETCSSSSTRLWGLMESAVNMGFFLSISFVLALTTEPLYKRSFLKYIKLIVIGLGLFFTGSRTFILLIPISLVCGLYISRKKIFISFIRVTFFSILLLSFLPILGAFFTYSDRWIQRLNFITIFSDESFHARTKLIQQVLTSIDFWTLLFGNGLGTYSRGVSAIDNGFLALLLETGAPITCLLIASIFVYFAKNKSMNVDVKYSTVSIAFLTFISNLSFAVFSGSSALFLWTYVLSMPQIQERYLA